jgi:SAM-dependent methyltransferase
MNWSRCPCCESALHATSIKHRLFDVLKKWEAHGVNLTPAAWADYPADTELTLYECGKCGFGVFLPMTIGTDAFYEDITREEYYLPERWDFHVAIKALRAASTQSVLDIGCGAGAFLRMLNGQLPSVECHGNDANPSVRAAFPPGASLHTSLSEAPEGMGAITLFQVIEHVADPLEMLQQGIAKVRPGGLVVVSVPDHSGPIRFFADSHTAIPPHHVSTWTPQSLDLICMRLGLKIVERKWEPLPDYLMPFYLHKILAYKLGWLNNAAREWQLKRFVAEPLIHFCRVFGIKYLPFRGHTYMVVAQKPD